MKINVNDKVRLKLTEHGHMAMAMCEYLKYDKVDADGWLELHLWEAMIVFGPFMFNGNPNLPFETNIELKPSVETIKHEVAARCDKPLFPEGKISQDEIALLFPDGLPVELVKVMFPELSEPLTSDELRFIMQAVVFQIANDRTYMIGPRTLEQVFEAAGLVNMSDLQAVLDAVERALETWSDIDTAPKDGRWILLSGGSYSDEAKGTSDVMVARWVPKQGNLCEGWLVCAAECGYSCFYYENPTKWMEVPR